MSPSAGEFHLVWMKFFEQLTIASVGSLFLVQD